ncbi:MAG: arginine repressor [Calditrichaeota bacterium]|nr:MAG: arginine repressor [Calditrichota bacterium]
MSKKRERQYTIKKIVQEEQIANQAQLLERLQQSGFKVTQATLSRDLQEMGIVRVRTSSGFRYMISEEEGTHSFTRIVSMEILSIDANESVVLVKTLTGRAKGVAIFIDRLEHPHILGTVAGESAVIVVPDSVKNIAQIKQDLESIVAT